MNKVKQLSGILEQVEDGSVLAFGGNVLHRSPIRVAKELAKLGKRNLHIVKTAMAMEADILCAFQCVSKVSAGFVGYESEYGLCNHYRKAVQSGEVIAEEHACYSVISALRAASYGIPFIPIRGFQGSDLPKTVGFLSVKDPYTGEELTAIRAIRPDFAFIHVQQADKRGNSRILGPVYEDQIIARSASHLVITCEELVDDNYFNGQQQADIPEVLVESVVVLPKGASPGSCHSCYGLDRDEIKRFKEAPDLQALTEVIQ